MLPPLLHILLGLGNDMYSKFKEYVKLQIELQSPEEIASLNMVLLAEIKHDEGMILFDDLQNDVRFLAQDRIELNAKLKQSRYTHEDKVRWREEKVSLLNTIKIKTKARDEAETNLNELKKHLAQCRKAYTKTKSDNKNPNRYEVINHIESVILKMYKISKSCYHAGDLEGNDVRRLMSKGKIVFSEIGNYLRAHKPSNVTVEEIDEICIGYGRLCVLMDSVFSTLHAKRGTITIDMINVLKSDLDLARIKFMELNLSFTPKFHMLYEHVPKFLLELNGFYDMGEDAIERWHQIRMRHHARIRSLRSQALQKCNQSKYEFTATDNSICEIIQEVKTSSKRNRVQNTATLKESNESRKKTVRLNYREGVKEEVKNEERVRILTPHEKAKEDYKRDHNL